MGAGGRRGMRLAVVALAAAAAVVLPGCAVEVAEDWVPPVRMAAFYGPQPENQSIDGVDHWNTIGEWQGQPIVAALQQNEFCVWTYAMWTQAYGCAPVAELNARGFEIVADDGTEFFIVPDGVTAAGYERISGNVMFRIGEPPELDFTPPDRAPDASIAMGMASDELNAWTIHQDDELTVKVAVSEQRQVILSVELPTSSGASSSGAQRFNEDGLEAGLFGGSQSVSALLLPDGRTASADWEPTSFPNLFLRR